MSSRTLPQLLVERAAATPGAVALREKDRGIWQEMTWLQYLRHVEDFSLGLRALGLRQGEHVAIIGDNRPEWYIAELAAQAAGAASVGLFTFHFVGNERMRDCQSLHACGASSYSTKSSTPTTTR
jgi:long-chain acyl-CoA synthetase